MGRYDRSLLVITMLLIGFGALMIYSTTSIITPALAKKGVTEFYYFRRHIFTILIGFIIMCIACYMKPSTIKKSAIPLLILSFVLLILVFLPGIGVAAGGAKRWIRLWPSTFQPSELVKLSMVIFLARYMSMPNYRADSFTSFIKPLIIMMIFQIAILKQPDFGAAMSLAFLTIAMLFLSGTSLRYLASLSVGAIPIVYVLITEPYRLRRITSFLDPWRDSQGSGFQLVQSFIALGSGGLTGVGLGSSKQKLSFLPESHTDFIFSIIGEEFGLIGLIFVITLFLLIFIRVIFIANKTKDYFVYYLAVGLSLLISLQALINFAVATGMVPTKGLPLPFISYGGSALLVNMAAVGILLSISKGEHIGTTFINPEIAKRRRAKRNIEKGKLRNRETDKSIVSCGSHSPIHISR
jgi:cell division protein FtsW